MLSLADSKIFSIENELTNIEKFKKGLLQQMFVYTHIFLNFSIENELTNIEKFKKGLLQQMFVYTHIFLNFCAKICCIKNFLKS